MSRRSARGVAEKLGMLIDKKLEFWKLEIEMQIDKRAPRYLSFFGFVSILIFFQERLRMQIDKPQLGSQIFFFRSNCLDPYLLPRTVENAD